MVMRPEPWGEALDAVLGRRDRRTPCSSSRRRRGSRSPRRWPQELAAEPRLVFACGRYEGIDRRVVDDAATRVRVREVSLGDYVLGGGEVAVLVIVEAVARLLPGVLGNAESLAEESHADGTLEYPVYTKPPAWRGREVPEVLLSGDHGASPRGVATEALRRTAERPAGPGRAALDPAALDRARPRAPGRARLGAGARGRVSAGRRPLWQTERRPAHRGGAIRRPTVPLPQGERTAIVPAQPTRERQLIRG